MSACRRRARRSAVDGLRHHQVCDKADGVEEGDEEHDVGRDPIEERDDPADDIALAARVRVERWIWVMVSSDPLGSRGLRSGMMPGVRPKDFARSLICP